MIGVGTALTGAMGGRPKRWWYRHVYLRSAHWRRFRAVWWAEHPGAVCAVCWCADGPMDLHHVTYERIGRELAGDVRPVHRYCHTLVEGRCRRLGRGRRCGR